MRTDRLAPYLLFVLISALFVLVSVMLQAAMPGQVALIVAEVACLLGFALFWRHHWEAPSPMRWPRWRQLGVPWWGLGPIFLSGFCFGFLSNTILALIASSSPAMLERATRYNELIEAMLHPEQAWLAAAAIVSVTVAAPVCEEALFRGTLLPMQREFEPIGPAIALNGLLFALLHLNVVGFLSLWMLGAIMAWLTWRTRSLWPAVLCHAGVNTFSAVIVPALAELSGEGATASLEESLPPAGELVGALAVAALLSAAILYAMHRLLPSPRGD